jgi:hypothetical protein
LDLSGANINTYIALQDEYAKIFRIETTDDEEITFYASEKPDLDIPVEIQIIRGFPGIG